MFENFKTIQFHLRRTVLLPSRLLLSKSIQCWTWREPRVPESHPEWSQQPLADLCVHSQQTTELSCRVHFPQPKGLKSSGPSFLHYREHDLGRNVGQFFPLCCSPDPRSGCEHALLVLCLPACLVSGFYSLKWCDLSRHIWLI